MCLGLLPLPLSYSHCCPGTHVPGQCVRGGGHPLAKPLPCSVSRRTEDRPCCPWATPGCSHHSRATPTAHVTEGPSAGATGLPWPSPQPQSHPELGELSPTEAHHAHDPGRREDATGSKLQVAHLIGTAPSQQKKPLGEGVRRGDNGDEAGTHSQCPLVTGKAPEPRQARSTSLYGFVTAPRGAPSWLPRTTKQTSCGCLRGTCSHCYQ